MTADDCCCGHLRWEHEVGGRGPCRRCGRGSCDRFHKIGEGHRAGTVVLVLAVIAIAAAIVFAAGGCR